MKKSITLLLVSLFTILLFTNSKVQDENDPNVGYYVDGVKVTELTCYSFKTLTLVLPYKESYNLFDRLVIVASLEPAPYEPGLGIAQSISKAELMTKFVKGKYIVYQIFKENSQHSCSTEQRYDHDLCRGVLAYYQKKDKPEAELKFTLEGQSIESYEERYDENCQCIKKEPVYNLSSATQLSEVKIPLKNRELKGGWATKTTCAFDVDLTQACSYPGTKVDFNKLK